MSETVYMIDRSTVIVVQTYPEKEKNHKVLITIKAYHIAE